MEKETPKPNDREWKCTGCGRIHPLWHRDCWWCKPPKRDYRSPPTGSEQNSEFMEEMYASEPH